MVSESQNKTVVDRVLRWAFVSRSSADHTEVIRATDPLPAIFFEHLRPTSSRNKHRWGVCVASTILIGTYLMAAAAFAFCSDVTMKGPEIMKNRDSASNPPLETSVIKLVLLGSIDLYRNRISPIHGSRCGFYPTCSAFGRQAVSEHGAVQGLMMTGDRLIRCNIFKEAGPDYYPLPGGRLFDPVSNNALSNP